LQKMCVEVLPKGKMKIVAFGMMVGKR
jgi:hypothetical protein